MAQDVAADTRLAESKREFGLMLRRWRVRNGWSGKIPGLWAKAAPDVFQGQQVSSATWTGFENGKAQAPAPETFLALACMNKALASGKIGAITDRQLRDRVAAGKPICHDDGTPWEAGDFFDCFIGALPPPKALQLPEFDASGESDRIRAEFTRAVYNQKIGKVAALFAMFQCSDLDVEAANAAEQVLLCHETFTRKEHAAKAWDALRQWTGSRASAA